MRRAIAIALYLVTSCQGPKTNDTTAAASVAPPNASAAGLPSAASVPSSTVSASSALPPASVSASAAGRACPDAGPPKNRPITLIYTQVMVPDRGRQPGTTFSVAFRGQAVPVPQASAIYSWCSLEKTEEPTTCELRCYKRQAPVCTIRVREDSVGFECGAVKRDIEVPCGERATLRLGRLPGGVAYN